MEKSLGYLLLVAFLFASYRATYWLSRRYYNLRIIKNEHISKTYSVITIMNQLGVILSGYIGSLFLDFIGVFEITIIACIFYVFSMIPIFLIDLKQEKIETNNKIELFKTIKQIPFNDIYLIGTYELTNVLKFYFTFYFYIYVKSNYQTVGIFNLITNLSVIVFAYLYGKKIDGAKNYLKLSIILISILLILKANLVSVGLVVVCILEGFVLRMYEISINKEVFLLSKNFEYNNYNLGYTLICKVFRLIILLIGCFIPNIKIMIYIIIGFIFFGAFIEFKQLKKCDVDKI